MCSAVLAMTVLLGVCCWDRAWIDVPVETDDQKEAKQFM